MLPLKQTRGDARITLLPRNKIFSSPVCTLINCNGLKEEGNSYFLTLKIYSTLHEVLTYPICGESAISAVAQLHLS